MCNVESPFYSSVWPNFSREHEPEKKEGDGMRDKVREVLSKTGLSSAFFFVALWGEKKLQTCAQLVDVESLHLVQQRLTCLQRALYDEAKWCPDIPGRSDLLAI